MDKLKKRKPTDIIKKVIITDKTTKFLEFNQYCFNVERKANKLEIKQAIEYLFKVKVKKINSYNTPEKKHTVGKFIGKKPQYKKAIVTLNDDYKINLFSDK
uniref:Ribosomal protein L23 n=1 Tax=Sporolithon durum TaxID=48970 RepID=A0A141SD95_9FLOR|nr:ribosomal protein L23 [Sporolithon durum]AMK96263.1 ribosomal protein L23 [Sporolithon durum]